MFSNLTANKKTTIFTSYWMRQREIASKMAAFKIRLRRVSTQNCSVLLTLLSLALVELLLSFPFSVFLLLDLDLVMLCPKFSTKIALTADSNTRTGNDLFSHNASTKSARNLTANQQKGGSAQGCKFHGWHSHQDVAYKNITRSLMTKSLGFQPESILPQVNTEQPRVIRKFQGYMTFETSYCEWRSAISISRFSFLFYDISHLLPFRRVGTIFLPKGSSWLRKKDSLTLSDFTHRVMDQFLRTVRLRSFVDTI